jgi:beta-glucosidase
VLFGDYNPAGRLPYTVYDSLDELAGDQVVQLYIHEVAPALKRPAKELRGFQRVPLAAGEKRLVTFTLPAGELAYYDTGSKKFTLKPGSFEILVGSSSEDIRLRGKLQVSE